MCIIQKEKADIEHIIFAEPQPIIARNVYTKKLKLKRNTRKNTPIGGKASQHNGVETYPPCKFRGNYEIHNIKNAI